MFGITSLTVPSWAAIAAIAAAAVAAIVDIRTRKIPNALTIPVVVAAVIAHGALEGAPGGLLALWGAVIAGGLLLPGWLMGWMGAGDVKAMAAVGAWLAYPASLVAVLAALIAGGILSLIVAARHGVTGRVVVGAARLGAWSAHPRGAGVPETTGLRFPFAAAILAGGLVSLWVRI
jgi:prepilin peptidase CpaA